MIMAEAIRLCLIMKMILMKMIYFHKRRVCEIIKSITTKQPHEKYNNRVRRTTDEDIQQQNAEYVCISSSDQKKKPEQTYTAKSFYIVFLTMWNSVLYAEAAWVAASVTMYMRIGNEQRRKQIGGKKLNSFVP